METLRETGFLIWVGTMFQSSLSPKAGHYVAGQLAVGSLHPPGVAGVLVVTWKSQRVYEQFIKPNTQSSRREDQLLWVTVAPQVKAFCQRYLQQHPHATEADLMLRLKQYLGLNPTWEYEQFVELWVSPQDLFRPCVNPDMTQRQCPLNFAGVVPKVTGHTQGTGIQDY